MWRTHFACRVGNRADAHRLQPVLELKKLSASALLPTDGVEFLYRQRGER